MESQITTDTEKKVGSPRYREESRALEVYFVSFFEPEGRTVNNYYDHCSACVCVVLLMHSEQSLMASRGSVSRRRFAISERRKMDSISLIGVAIRLRTYSTFEFSENRFLLL